MSYQYPPMNGISEPKKKPSKWKWGCLGCLGLIVLGFFFLIIIGIIGALVAPPSSSPSASASPSATASPITPSATPSETKTASPAPTSSPSETRSPSPTESGTEETTQTAAPIGGSDAPEASTALETLETLDVKGRAPKTGYDRDKFGAPWEDVDHNGCSTRNDILARDLTQVQKDPDGCKVKTGTLADPYTGQNIDFVAGRSTSDAVQIDHVVALSDAWQKGAQQLSAGDRLTFANDPLNLLAVDGPTNQTKGDGDAATWLPPNRSYWCPYTARQVEVKSKYHLWVTPAEHDKIKEILSDCPDASADKPAENGPQDEKPKAPDTPAKADPALPAPIREPVAPAGPKPVAPQPAAPNEGAGSFANCAAARAANAAPLYAGSPGYSPKLDRDGDGVACE